MGNPGAAVPTRTLKAGTPTNNDSTGQGFTLIELVIVLAVISLLLGLAVPTISSLSRNDLRSTAASMAEIVRHGRNQAIMTARKWEVEVDLKQGIFLTRPAKGKGMQLQRVTRGDVRIASILFPDRAKDGEETTQGRATIHILQRGLVEPAIIVLRDGERQLRLSVVPFTGRLRIEDGADSAGSGENS